MTLVQCEQWRTSYPKDSPVWCQGQLGLKGGMDLHCFHPGSLLQILSHWAHQWQPSWLASAPCSTRLSVLFGGDCLTLWESQEVKMERSPLEMAPHLAGVPARGLCAGLPHPHQALWAVIPQASQVLSFVIAGSLCHPHRRSFVSSWFPSKWKQQISSGCWKKLLFQHSGLYRKSTWTYLLTVGNAIGELPAWLHPATLGHQAPLCCPKMKATAHLPVQGHHLPSRCHRSGVHLHAIRVAATSPCWATGWALNVNVELLWAGWYITCLHTCKRPKCSQRYHL